MLTNTSCFSSAVWYARPSSHVADSCSSESRLEYYGLYNYFLVCACVCSVTQSCPTSQPHGLSPARLLCPWNFPGKNTGVGCHFLLQGIFRPRDLTCVSSASCFGRQILPLSHPGSPSMLMYVPSISTLSRFFFYFYHEWMLDFVKYFFCIYWGDLVIFILCFVNEMYYTGLWMLNHLCVVVQLHTRVWLFVTPWTAARQASLSLTIWVKPCPRVWPSWQLYTANKMWTALFSKKEGAQIFL